MATFWTGAALAADYGQNRVRSLGVAMRPHETLPQHERLARREAFKCLNRAIDQAVQAQLDDQEMACCPLADSVVNDDDWLMHCGGMECYFCVLPNQAVVVAHVDGL